MKTLKSILISTLLVLSFSAHSATYTAKLPRTIIYDSKEVKELVTKVQSLTSEDILIMEVNSTGGHVDAGMEIIRALENTKGQVIAHVTGIAASMAAVIIMHMRDVWYDDEAIVIIHVPRVGVDRYGKLILPVFDPDFRLTWNYFSDSFVNVLDKEEFDKVFVEHQDFFILGKELERRVKSISK